MNNLLIYAAVLCAGSFWLGYNLGAKNERIEFDAYRLQAEQSYSVLMEQKLKQEHQYAAKIEEMESEYHNTLDELKAEHDATIASMRKSFKPSGVLKCNSTTKSGGNKRPVDSTSGLICYTPSELQSRIERTLAIGNDCDVLQAKYEAILRVIEEYNAKKRQVD